MAALPNPEANSQATLKLENTEKRDSLRVIEEKYQKEWADAHIFEVDAPNFSEIPASVSPDELHKENPKFFGTMAYPYVNGVPHLGHAFSVSKVEFAARANRALGRRVLYPQGFHCTGMPIKACADKLVNEVAMFGQNFEGYEAEEAGQAEADVPEAAAADGKAGPTDVTKYSNLKRGKAALKGGSHTYQFQTMLAIGVPREEVHKFQNPHYWLEYFPPLWRQDMGALGCSVDWRRSFVTTDANPYYDSFVQWQMRTLKGLNKIQYGSRYTVYSPKDQQPCLDHDRSSGEGVLVQEYTAVKCKVKTWSDRAAELLKDKLPAGANVYLVPATLRPETMYGQTNVFVSPKITYGIFKASESEYYLITNRSARNMAFQNVFKDLKWGETTRVAEISGADVVGTLINAPLSFRKEVYVVPMDTIKDTKGTGVVTSVPSDSPDDYAMTVELAKKPEYYKIRPEWVSPDDILPIIETPEYGNLIAPTLVKQLKINSPKDAKLVEAKATAYKQGFYNGVMVYGEYKGNTVEEAKPKVRKALIDSGEAFPYSEPDGQVISRSGDECVAALLPQWFLTYGDGDPAWREDVLNHVKSSAFNAYTQETLNSIERTLEWMNQWAVTRQFGLGTKLPWDQSQLVESLSDSTIYMAYYTVSRFLHSDIYGKEPGVGKIAPSQMTDAVWDYVFSRTDSVESDIPQETLAVMRREFQYWYPLDVRSSGKDLINNHLIFMLYHHQAIWAKQPQYLPRGIRMNGHAMLNGEKMSKSTGNFLTLHDAVAKFGADAVRIALADAGDGIEDANIDETVANAVILKLYELKAWVESVILHPRILKDGEDTTTKEVVRDLNAGLIQRSGSKKFWDEIFENDLNALAKETIGHYDQTFYKAALKSGFYDLTAARDSYREATRVAGIGMHQDLVRQYVELQARLLAPLAPHWAEYVWRDALKNKTYISVERFPTVADTVPRLTEAANYIRNTTSAISVSERNAVKKQSKGKATSYDPKANKKLTIFVAKSWPAWHEKYIRLVQELFDGMTLDLKAVSKRVDKADSKKAMPFIQTLKKKLETGGKEAVESQELPFDELAVLHEMVPGLKKTTLTKLQEVVIVQVDAEGKGTHIAEDGTRTPGPEVSAVAASAEPGNPTFELVNV